MCLFPRGCAGTISGNLCNHTVISVYTSGEGVSVSGGWLWQKSRASLRLRVLIGFQCEANCECQQTLAFEEIATYTRGCLMACPTILIL
jgi:hypothetical protein